MEEEPHAEWVIYGTIVETPDVRPPRCRILLTTMNQIVVGRLAGEEDYSFSNRYSYDNIALKWEAENIGDSTYCGVL